MTDTAAITIVRDFCAAWDRMDWDAVTAALSDDIFYHNIPMAPVEGIAAFKAFLTGFAVSAAEFEIHHIAGNGNVVMTERTDRFLIAGKRVVISAHGNSLRALVKHLSGISDDEITGLEIPTGQPIVYELDDNLAALERYYLAER